jgi:hypothetical protein
MRPAITFFNIQLSNSRAHKHTTLYDKGEQNTMSEKINIL